MSLAAIGCRSAAMRRTSKAEVLGTLQIPTTNQTKLKKNATKTVSKAKHQPREPFLDAELILGAPDIQIQRFPMKTGPIEYERNCGCDVVGDAW